MKAKTASFNDRLKAAQHLLSQGRAQEAEAALRKLLGRHPRHPGILAGLGQAALQQGRLAEGATFLLQAEAAGAKLNLVLSEGLGIALVRLDRLDEALTVFERIAATWPDLPGSHHNLGLAHQQLGRYEDAMACLDRGLALDESFRPLHVSKGHLLLVLGRHAEALAHYQRALELGPGDAGLHNNRGNCLMRSGRVDEALDAYRQALVLEPDFGECYSNLGKALGENHRFEEALEVLDRAVALRPDMVEAHSNRGLVLKELGRLDESMAAAEQAVAIDPGFGNAQWNRALLLLTQGRYEEGWPLYEWRWQRSEPLPGLDLPQPLWLGREPVAGKTILIWFEQGFGDFIQFCRLVPRVEALGARVLLYCLPPLLPLAATLPGDRLVTSNLRDLPPFDLHCPLLSLPLALGITLRNLPAQVPYLFAPAGRLAEWAARLGPRTRPRVGLAWSGAPNHQRDRLRSLPLADLEPLFRLPMEFHSLHPQNRPEDADALSRHPELRHHGDALHDFADTAALAMHMDLLISVDTATAHLAGALGKPVWVLLSLQADFRWLLDRRDSPWYPTATLFRQRQARDWSGVIAAVAEALAGLADAPDALESRLLAPPDSGEISLESPRTQPDDAGMAAQLHAAEGQALHESHHYAEALAKFDQAVALAPDVPLYYWHRGNVLRDLDRHEEALTTFDQALTLDPDFADAHQNRAIALHALGRSDEALAVLDQAVALAADIPLFHWNRANVLREMRRFEEAVASYDRALSLNPDFGEALHNRAVALHESKRSAEALANMDRALELCPDSAELHYDRSVILSQQNRYDEAILDLDRALLLKPNHVTAHNNRGIAHLALGHLEQALTDVDAALACTVDEPTYLSNRGLVLQELHRFDEAEASFSKAHSVNPSLEEALLNLGLVRLLRGDYQEGWRLYERRWKISERPPSRNLSLPFWLGEEPLAGRTIVLWPEQGFGDFILCSRFIPLVDALGGKVVVEVWKELLPLTEALPGRGILVPQGDPLPDADLQCPMMSLPLALGITLDNLPHTVPYLSTPPERRAIWSQRLGRSDRLRVGLAWSGASHHSNDRKRSIPLERLLPLLEAPAEFHSLQLNYRPADLAVLQSHPEIRRHEDRLEDFADTAALIEEMDLVIAVDTSIAHLAGALGKPLWIMLPHFPDFRWLLDRRDSPWYPTATLFRQPGRGDWTSVIAEVAQRLKAEAAGFIPAPPAPAATETALPMELAAAGNFLKSGQAAEAEAAYRLLVEAHPGDPRALQGMGQALLLAGRFDDGVDWLRQAVGAGCRDCGALNDLSLALMQLGRPKDALGVFDLIAELWPGDPLAHYNSGLVRLMSKRYSEALTCFERGLAEAEDNSGLLQGSGVCLLHLHRYEEAAANLTRAIALQPPTDSAAYKCLGEALMKLGQPETALAEYRKALDLAPEDAEALAGAGLALLSLRQVAAALPSLDRAIALEPQVASYHLIRGKALKALSRLNEARDALDQALVLEPELAEAWTQRGNVLNDLGLMAEALADHDRAVSLQPDEASAHNSRAVTLLRMLRLDEALAALNEALRLHPNDRLVHWNKAVALLFQGHYREGWPLYEARFDTVAERRLSFPDPPWLGGEPVAGRTLLLWQDHGYGDFIQFCRYVPLLEAQGARVILLATPPVAALATTLSGHATVMMEGGEMPAFDLHCPLMSLPLAMGTTLDTIPASVPYLAPDPIRQTAWQDRLGPRTRPRVGLVWSGNRQHADDRNRSLPLEMLAPLLALPAEFHALGVDIRPTDLPSLNAHPEIRRHDGELADFAETAALIAELDLVVAVDTAVAHLAGALGKPVWILLPFFPDFRWLVDRTDSPWYPTATLFRQAAPGEWDSLMAAVAGRLAEWLAAAEAGGVPPAEPEDPLHDLTQAESRGLELLRGGRPDAALAALDRALAAERALAARLQAARGEALIGLQRPAEALADLDGSLALWPDRAETHHLRGRALRHLGRGSEALASYDRALELDPACAAAHCDRGNALAEQGHVAEALASYDRALTLNPDLAEALSNQGSLLQALGQPQEALASYDRALALAPTFAACHSNRGALLVELGRIDEAASAFDQALELDPSLLDSRINRGLLWLKQGEFQKGWPLYESRLHKNPSPRLRDCRRPLWRGRQPLAGRRILLRDEQGYGDSIQFWRYVPELAAQGAKVLLETPPALVALAASLAGHPTLIPVGAAEPDFDFHCPLMSLPAAFDTRLDSIPSAVPYLAAPPERVDRWRRRLGPKSRLRVGLAWAGSALHRNDRNRSIPLKLVESWLELPAEFHALQTEIRPEDLTRLERMPVIRHDTELADFADTAALLGEMDLVITVDTSAAHLAGALARPVWIMLPHNADFRWLLNRTDTPWYPTATLFRQPAPGDWAPVITQIHTRLAAQTR